MTVHKKTFGALLIALTLLTACGSNMLEFVADKNSDAANKEAAQILIDSGDYDAAIAVLASACPNFTCASAEDAGQLAAAYMGAAGLDVLDLIKSVDENSGSNVDGSDFTVIAELLPDITADNFTKIDSAVELLSSISDPTDDQLLQLSIAQLTAAVMAIGQAGGGGFDADGVPNSCSGACDSTDTDAILATFLTDANGNPITAGAYVTAAINDSITNINNISALADSDISDQMNNLAADMQGSTSSCDSGGGTPSGSLLESDVNQYLLYCI